MMGAEMNLPLGAASLNQGGSCYPKAETFNMPMFANYR